MKELTQVELNVVAGGAVGLEQPLEVGGASSYGGTALTADGKPFVLPDHIKGPDGYHVIDVRYPDWYLDL